MSLDLDDVEAQKRAAAEAAVGQIEPGMLVGLGTGTTAALAIAALARQVRAGLTIQAVATSVRTAAAARQAGIHVIDFAEVQQIDLAIDGVDEIDGRFRAIKGGGGAMLREKIVASAALSMIAIADASKPVRKLGDRPVPLEVLPFARSLVLRRVRELGSEAAVRMVGDTPFRTDQANLVIDCRFANLDDPQQLARDLESIPGVLGHGLFLREIDRLYVGTRNGVERHDRPNIL